MAVVDIIHISQVAAPSPGFDLMPVLDLNLERPVRFVRDVNRQIHKKGITNPCPNRLTILVTQQSTSMTNFNYLEHWLDTCEEVDIDDLAYSGGAGVPATDAYIHRYRGFVESIRALSPEKMMLGEYNSFEITFLIHEYWVITV